MSKFLPQPLCLQSREKLLQPLSKEILIVFCLGNVITSVTKNVTKKKNKLNFFGTLDKTKADQMMLAVPLGFRKSKTHQEICPFIENNKNCIKDSIFKLKKSKRIRIKSYIIYLMYSYVLFTSIGSRFKIGDGSFNKMQN